MGRLFPRLRIFTRTTLGVALYSILLYLLYIKWTSRPGDSDSYSLRSILPGELTDNDTQLSLQLFKEELPTFLPKCFHDIKELAQNLSPRSWRLEIVCNQSAVLIQEQEISLEEGAYTMNWTDHLPCLKDFVKDHCYERSADTIPNIVHYVWLGSHPFRADNFLSVLSAQRYQQPCAILILASECPYGPYWQVLLSLVSNVIVVLRRPPTSIYGRSFGYIQHQSDIVRLELLKELGGIYLDADQLLLRSVEDLQSLHFVMSHENQKNLANSMMLSEPGAKFIDLWHRQYKHYNPKMWGYHSTFVPWHLARQNPQLITVVGNLFVNPDLGDIEKVYKSHYNLTNNYGLHLYTRFLKQLPISLPDVTTWNSSLGEVCRSILYNSPETFACPQTIS